MMQLSTKVKIWLAIAGLAAGSVQAQQLIQSADQVTAVKSGKVKYEQGVISLKVDDPEWSSGMEIKPPAGQTTWNLTQWKALAMEVENLSPNKQMRITFHLSSGSKETKNLAEINTGIGLNPGEKRTMRIWLPHEALYKAPEGGKGPKTIDTAHLHPLKFQIQWPYEAKTPGLIDCRITNLRGEQPQAVPTAPVVAADKYFPFIDRYGQFMHADWPEKIHTDADLRRNLAEEQKLLAATKRPETWNEYGGWANGPQLKATGSFRAEKYQDKWFLVDPSGKLFISHGLDVLYPQTDATKVKEHEKWFEKIPAGAQSIPFNELNLQIKFGKKNFYADFYRMLSKRLEAWGINTIGNWGKDDFMAVAKTPYVLQLKDYSASWPGIKGSKLKFYDVFDPHYVELQSNLLAQRVKDDAQTKRSLTDPMCIGYFIDNELKYEGFVKEVMKGEATQPAKIELVKDLKQKYGDIGSLNKAWKTNYATWNAILDSHTEPNSDGYRKDAQVFQGKAEERYFELCRAGIKKVAPHRLYLGARLVGFREPAHLWAAMAKSCDVISVNSYCNSVANTTPSNFHDKPVIIGEFHFGIMDRGMFSAGLCPAGLTQADRAVAYTRYMQGVLTHPNMVGAHWFQFRDQPLTGRWDGEGYQIGFVDVADTPYPELTAAARKVGENMYQYRMTGKLNNAME